jgi:hypothetical protein
MWRLPAGAATEFLCSAQYSMGDRAPRSGVRLIPSSGMGAQSPTSEDRVILYGSALPRNRRSRRLGFFTHGWHMHIDTISALGLSIRVGTTSVREPRRPLLVFNGIGASIELVAPFTEAMQRVGIPSVVFDIPGLVGPRGRLGHTGSPVSRSSPARFWTSGTFVAPLTSWVSAGAVRWRNNSPRIIRTGATSSCSPLHRPAPSWSRDVWRRS